MAHFEIKGEEKRVQRLRIAATVYASRKNGQVSFARFILALLDDDPEAIRAKNQARRFEAAPRHALRREEVRE